MTAPDDEELHQPRRRIGTGVLTSVVGAAVVLAGAAVVLSDDDRTGPAPVPERTSTAAPTSATESPPPSVTDIVAAPPAALLRAVEAAYPRAELVEFGLTVPVRAVSDRNYQFIAGGRRITVVVGPADSRPTVRTSSARDVLVVAKRSGHRVVVTVRAFRGTLRDRDVVAADRLSRDTRLLTTP